MAGAPKKRLLEQLKLDGFWDNMSPNQRRGATVVLVVSAMFLLIGMITGGDGEGRTKTRDTVIRSVLTDTDTRSIGIDALNAKVKRVESENGDLRKQLDRVTSELKEVRSRRGNDPDVTRQIGILQSRLESLTALAKQTGWEVEDIKEGYYTVDGQRQAGDQPKQSKSDRKSNVATAPAAKDKPKSTNRVEEGLERDPSYYFRTAPVRPADPAPAAGAPSLRNGAIPGGGLQIFVTESVAQSTDDEEKEKKIFLPSGSILSGIMLNGLDAATGRGARKDPFPVLVRIQKEALLPNEFTADIKECHVTLAGYGELSSERAYLRGETFSCITNDGEVIEEEFPAYAVGEDGKAGIRGRLVSKAGSLIAKTAVAGFAAGVAEAFDTSPVPVIQTDSVSSNKVYQDNFSSEAARHGTSKGASEAMTRLADYYMDMADQIFPVIEVDAGRTIDIVLTSGFQLDIRKPSTKKSKPKKKAK
ncbi:TraB/VirB10 family protein (plasmid) [Maricurvus nonylphenolicus]|uniref:TraB/VirB10 family protein n=1 Tax=Maricurvus nonylphenolicus TaxID=1008307 RepID=UPI0036F3A0B9